MEALLTHETTRVHGSGRGPDFYRSALSYAQSLWRQGRPAQAILQLNKAFMADLLPADASILEAQPPPYEALAWMLRHRPEGRFAGNPVRHFQHLATRMSGPRAAIRTWRAWACFHIARELLPTEEFPPDEAQVKEDALVFPTWEEVVVALESDGWPSEAAIAGKVRDDARRTAGDSPR